MTLHAAIPALSGERFDITNSSVGRVEIYASVPAAPSDDRPLVLIHSVNAAGSAFEVRPLYDHYAKVRPTYALDLPGFGLSDRTARKYSPRLMTDAVHAVVQAVRERHAGAPVDALAVSLGCEFLARAAGEDPGAFRTLALVSPTGFDGTKRREGPTGSTRAVPGLHAVVGFSLWSRPLFSALTRPSVVRFFLEKTWGRKEIDEELWAYDVRTARAPGAEHAPLSFVAGKLFSNDVDRLYDSLKLPVWMAHGVRGDFVDYRRADRMASRENWTIDSLPTGALPHFEVPEDFIAKYDAFLARPSGSA